MSRATSTGTGKPYGLQRVCRVLGFPRSTIYAGRARVEQRGATGGAAARPETQDAGR